jgi:undecaprenyl-diphosphatase
MGYWDRLDYSIFNVLNSWAGDPTFNAIVVFLAHYLIWLVIPAALLYPAFKNSRRDAVKIVLTASVSFVLARLVFTESIRAIIYRDRPFITNTVTQLIQKTVEASFPSGHTVAVVAIGAGLFIYDKPIGGLVIFMGIVIGVSRVIAGVHFPADILAGLVIGLLSGWLAGMLIKKWQNNIH